MAHDDPDRRILSSERLAALQRTNLLDSSPEEAFDRLARLAGRLLKTPVALVSLVDRDRQFFKSQVGLPQPWATDSQTPLSHSFCQHVVTSGEPLVIEDARTHPLVTDNLAIRDLGVVAYAGIPLTTREGHVLGSFCAIDSRPRAWQEEELSLLRDLAASVMTEIELRTVAQEARRQAEQMAALLESTGEGLYGIDREGNCTFINRAALQMLGYAPEEVAGRNMHGLIHHTRPDGSPYPQEECPIFRAAQTGQGCRMDDEVLWRRDGSSFPAEYSAFPLLESGEITGAVATLTDITQRKQAEAELAAAYEKEHRIADSLQGSLLSKPAANTFSGLEVEPLYQPAWDEAQVGGDLFDVFALPDGQVALLVADVSGKGLAAATRTMEIKYTLRAFLREGIHPARAVARLNQNFCDAQRLDSHPNSTFVCLSLAVVDPASGHARFTVAGAEPPLLLRATGETEEIRATGLPVGVAPDMEYRATEVELARGDLVLMATDGITEARCGKAFLGYEGMVSLAKEALSLPSLSQIGQTILEGARAFTGGPFQDDICLLLARRTGADQGQKA